MMMDARLDLYNLCYSKATYFKLVVITAFTLCSMSVIKGVRPENLAPSNPNIFRGSCVDPA